MNAKFPGVLNTGLLHYSLVITHVSCFWDLVEFGSCAWSKSNKWVVAMAVCRRIVLEVVSLRFAREIMSLILVLW